VTRTFPIIKRGTKIFRARIATEILRCKDSKKCIHLLKMPIPVGSVMHATVFTGVDPTVDTTIACPPLQNQLAPS